MTVMVSVPMKGILLEKQNKTVLHCNPSISLNVITIYIFTVCYNDAFILYLTLYPSKHGVIPLCAFEVLGDSLGGLKAENAVSAG